MQAVVAGDRAERQIEALESAFPVHADARALLVNDRFQRSMLERRSASDPGNGEVVLPRGGDRPTGPGRSRSAAARRARRSSGSAPVHDLRLDDVRDGLG
jgi:hypothetical protein